LRCRAPCRCWRRDPRREVAGEELVAVECLRAREAGELRGDIGQRKRSCGTGGDRREIEDGAPDRIGVVRQLEHRVGEEGRQASGYPVATSPGEDVASSTGGGFQLNHLFSNADTSLAGAGGPLALVGIREAAMPVANSSGIIDPAAASVADAWSRLTEANYSVDPMSLEIEIRRIVPVPEGALAPHR